MSISKHRRRLPTSVVLSPELKECLARDNARTGLSYSFLIRQILMSHYGLDGVIQLKQEVNA